MTATTCVKADRLIAQPDGSFTVRKHDAIKGDGVLSVQPDGTLDWRPAGTKGPWETCRRVGNKLVFTDSAYPLGGYALLVSD